MVAPCLGSLGLHRQGSHSDFRNSRSGGLPYDVELLEVADRVEPPIQPRPQTRDEEAEGVKAIALRFLPRAAQRTSCCTLLGMPNPALQRAVGSRCSPSAAERRR